MILCVFAELKKLAENRDSWRQRVRLLRDPTLPQNPSRVTIKMNRNVEGVHINKKLINPTKPKPNPKTIDKAAIREAHERLFRPTAAKSHEYNTRAKSRTKAKKP